MMPKRPGLRKPLVFISHAGADGDKARAFRRWLLETTSSAVDFFLSSDRDSLQPGDLWMETMTRALDRADMIFVLVSQRADRSSWVAFEAGYASGQAKPVIPILVPGFDPSRLQPPLQLRQYVSMDSPDALSAVVQKLNSSLATSFTANAAQDTVNTIFGPPATAGERWLLEAVPLASRAEIYAEIVRLIKAADRQVHVRATSTLPDRTPDTDPAFESYLRCIAAKCAEAENQGDVADYTLIMSFPVDENALPPLDRQESIRQRQAAFANVGASNRLTILRLSEHWLVDVMTIGDDHAIIAFPGRGDDPRLRNAIRVSGREFVSRIIYWFDVCVRPLADRVDPATLQVLTQSRSA